MKRLPMLTAAVASTVGVTVVLAVTVVLVAPGSAHTSGGRMLTFLDDTNHASQAFIDSAPKSPTRNPRSARFRLSTGDMLYVRSPIHDADGAKRIGTAYSQFTVVKGNSFANVVFRGHGTFRLHDGQITADGVFRAANATNTIAVLGGTGAYEGARGSLTFTEVAHGSQDTIHLLS